MYHLYVYFKLILNRDESSQIAQMNREDEAMALVNN